MNRHTAHRAFDAVNIVASGDILALFSGDFAAFAVEEFVLTQQIGVFDELAFEHVHKTILIGVIMNRRGCMGVPGQQDHFDFGAFKQALAGISFGGPEDITALHSARVFG